MKLVLSYHRHFLNSGCGAAAATFTAVDNGAGGEVHWTWPWFFSRKLTNFPVCTMQSPHGRVGPYK